MSNTVNKKIAQRLRRKVRVRKHVFGTETRPRLNVFRSAKHMYAQIIDDVAGKTLVAVSTLGKAGVKAEGNKTDEAKAVGIQLAAACKEKNIAQVVFDRNGYKYHGRVRAVAEAAREGGLQF